MALLTNLIWPLSSFRQYVLLTQGLFLSTIWSNDIRYEHLDNMDQKHYVKQYALSKPRHVYQTKIDPREQIWIKQQCSSNGQPFS